MTANDKTNTDPISSELPVSATEESSASSAKFDLVAIEHNILNFWKESGSFQELMKKNSSGPLFRFLDGPITANNAMGVHHAWGRMIKDAAQRYRALKGFRLAFQNGFDCQGLWVEVEVEKVLQLGGKDAIEEFGIEKFSEACKDRVRQYAGVITNQSIRLGQWMDWDHSYYTHADRNIEGIWKALKKCWDNGWLAKADKSMMWCPRCGTSLSEHEMSGSYRDISHKVVFVRSYIPALDAEMLVWTTTPWTLAANTALAVHPSLDYSFVSLPGEKRQLILATATIPNVFGQRKDKPKTESVVKGTELIGLEYTPFLEYLPVQKSFEHRIVPWNAVEAAEGTGVVHIAPGCGAEDYQLGQEQDLKIISPIDGKACYFEDYGMLTFKNVSEATPEIIAQLERDGKLLRAESYMHSYPVCWRCKQEVVFRLASEWFIKVDEIRPRLIEAATKVEWQPEYAGKLMRDWLTNMSDWCISRKRYWGLPLPIYECSKCNTTTVLGSRDDLARLANSDLKQLKELHRPWIDEIEISCPQCAAKVKRIPEVGDCWLDAGIVPYSTDGCYDDAEKRTGWQPADYVVEMREQVRLWFYSMLFMGVILDGKAPYKKVQTHEPVVNEDGAKFSKSGRNLSFESIADEVGADAIRYLYSRQSPLYEVRFGVKMAEDARRQLLSFWNIKSFFELYANIDKPDLSGSKGFGEILPEDPSDVWLLSRTASLLREAELGFEGYSIPQVVKEFERYIEELSNFYIRSNRRRFWKSESGKDKDAAFNTLFIALRTVTVAMSPLIPFVTEQIWQDAIVKFDASAPGSVHLADWPKGLACDESILKQCETVRGVINLAHRLRAESRIKIKQPVRALILQVSDEVKNACERFKALILGEVNVKALEYVADSQILYVPRLEFNFKEAGPILRGNVNKGKAAFEALGEPEKAAIIETLQRGENVRLSGIDMDLAPACFTISKAAKPGLLLTESEFGILALDTAVTEDLENEGMLRETLRHIQVLRKEAGFDVQDRVLIGIKTEIPKITQVMKEKLSFVEHEALAKVSFDSLASARNSKEVSISAGKLTLYIAAMS